MCTIGQIKKSNEQDVPSSTWPTRLRLLHLVRLYSENIFFFKNHQKRPLFRGFLIHKQRKSKEKRGYHDVRMSFQWGGSCLFCTVAAGTSPAALDDWPRYTKTIFDPPKVRAISRRSCGTRLQGDVAFFSSTTERRSFGDLPLCRHLFLFSGTQRHQYNVNVVCLTAATVYTGVGDE